MMKMVVMTSEQFEAGYKLVSAIMDSPEASEELLSATASFWESVAVDDTEM